jgi:hypothetical protein
VSIIFNISRITISLWLKRQSETGDFEALPNKPPGNGHKITDGANFRKLAHCRIPELGKAHQLQLQGPHPEVRD